MEATPQKAVHFAPGFSPSSIGSPFSEASSSDSVTSSSTLQYVNSQLVSHGFTIAPGLALDGLSNGESEKVVKCLFAMLSQRMEDMNRTEELTTKLRTLSYDHDRLQSMNRSATEKAANAEREASTHKSKFATATRALQQSEASHKHTTGELQRTRTSLQALRSTHQAELKKKEKETERMVEKWSKLSDAQLKLGSVGSGMTIKGANADVVEGPSNMVLGRSNSLVEVALEQAEQACKQLREENTELKNLIVDIANAVRKILHKAVSEDPEDFEFPPPLETIDLFPLGTPDAAFERLSTLLTSLRDALTSLRSAPSPRLSQSDSASSEEIQTTIEATARRHAADIERLEKTISSLRLDLEKAQSESSAFASRIQSLSNRRSQNSEASADPARANEVEKLERRHYELEDEQATFADAALRLGREKADLETERIKFLEEKRAWCAQAMLSDLPPLATSSKYDLRGPSTPSRKSPRKSRLKISSPRRSPIKASSSKRTRVFRRSSSGPGLGLAPAPSTFIPSYETEVIPASVPSALLPTSFVLPPPSPQSRLPPRTDALLAPGANGPPPQPHALSTTPPYPDDGPPATGAPETETAAPPPRTPPFAARPFPMAKPFAPRMVHAYSPVKPSPLSRILMLADSPEGGAPPLSALAAVAEGPASGDGERPLRAKQAAGDKSAQARPPAKRSLATAAADRPGAAGPAEARAPVPEKENTIKRRLKGPATNRAKAPPPAAPATQPQPASTKSRLGASHQMPPGKSGPRRVPIDSAEAAPIGPGWRG